MKRFFIPLLCVGFAVLTIFGFSGLTDSLGDKRRTNVQFSTENNLGVYGIEIVSSDDPQFDSIMHEYVGGIKDIQAIVNEVKPFLVFVRNVSDEDVVGVSLRWRLTSSDGREEISRQIESTSSELMNIKPVDPWMEGKTALLKAKSIRLFSNVEPVGQIAENIHSYIKYRRGEPIKITQDLMSSLNRYAISEKERRLRDTISLSVSVDGIFFSNGSFAGDDRNRFYDSMRGMLEAERTFRNEFAKAKVSSKNTSVAINQLSNSRRESTPATIENNEDAFRRAYNMSWNRLIDRLTSMHSQMSDEEIEMDILRVKPSDFVTLRHK